MSHSQQDASPQRTATRAPVGRPIRLQFDGETDIIEGICGNISIGGMFIEVNETRSHGSLVRFDLALDDGDSIRGLAEVVWARSKSFGPGDDIGIGIKFRFLEQKDRQLIFKLVSQFIKERLANRTPLTPDSQAPATEGIFHPPDGAAQAQDGPDPPTVEVPVVGSALDRQQETSSEAAWQQAGSSPVVDEEPVPSSGLDAQPAAPLADVEAPTPSPQPQRESLGPSFLDDDPIDLNGRDSGTIWRPDPELTGAIDAPAPGAFGGNEIQPPRRVSRRPKNRSSLMPLLLIGVILAVLVFMFRDKLFGPPPPMDEPLPAQMEPAPGSVDGVIDNADGERLARRASGTEGSAGVVGNQPQVGTETVGATSSNEPPASAEPSASSPPPPAPTPQSTPPPPSAAPPPPPPAAGANEFTQVTDIQWRRIGEGVEITVTANGVIPQRRLSNFRLDGNEPREVIQLLGVQNGYSQRTIAVDAPGVRQIRTGLNDRRSGKELRLVLDLTGPSARLESMRPNGRTLVIRIEVD